jgi:hypothetical protein
MRFSFINWMSEKEQCPPHEWREVAGELWQLICAKCKEMWPDAIRK